ncbi:MAG: hypothetical protein R3C60_06910 [Parvularculaceae bacterium]
MAFSGRDTTRATGPVRLFVAKDDTQGQTRVSFSSFSDGATIDEFAFSLDGSRVAYRGKPSSIEPAGFYVAAITGSFHYPLSPNPGGVNRAVSDFDWAPDGMSLIYSGNFGQNSPYLLTKETYSVDRDGSNRTKVNGTVGTPPRLETRNARWSPNGAFVVTEIAAIVGSNGQGSTNANGLNVYPDGTPSGGFRLIEVPSGLIRNWRISPANDRVCYNASSNGASGFRIYTSDATVGSSNVVGLSDTGHFNSECRWSANGKLVAYLEQNSVGGPADLEVRPGDASASATVVVSLSATGRTITKYEWAPGSNDAIAYIADGGIAGVRELFITRVSGGAPVKLNVGLIPNGDVLDFAWSPDRTKIAYIADAEVDADVQLYISNADGSGKIKVSDFLNGEEVDQFVWSADSTRLAFSAGPIGGAADRLYVATADGVSSQMINTTTIATIENIAYAP